MALFDGETKGKRTGLFISLAVFGVLCVPLISLGQGLVPCEGANCNFASFIELADRVIDFLLFKISVPIASILFMYAGFLYVTAAGNPTQISKATGIFKNVGIGFILALSGWLIVNLITTALLKPGYGGFLYVS